jgi:thiol-disulfide isomerase/thioredoxin
MQKPAQVFLVVAVALSALAAGLYFRGSDERVSTTVTAPPAAVMDTALAGLDGRKAKLSDWKGKVMVVNFWATWCAPCRKEIPEFIRMQSRLGPKGLQFVGIAIDEMDKVKAYAQEVGINYPLLVGEIDAVEVSRAFGNELGALPFTVIIDRQGRVVRTELGGTNEAKLGPVVEPLLDAPAN